MDISTVLGVLIAFGLIVAAVTMGTGIGSFLDVPSMMIVIGGTLGTTCVNFPLKEVLSVVKVVRNAFFAKRQAIDPVLSTMVDFAGKARRDGILALEGELKTIQDPFFSKALQLAIDGLEPQSIETILTTELEFVEERHKLGADIFATMGALAPAMGLIGTLIGLVQMLQRMDDPSTIGPSMAVALLTTFYGAVLANVLFNPISGKLRTRSQQEVMVKELIKEGILSIIQGDNPRIMEQKLHAFLEPKLRQSKFTK